MLFNVKLSCILAQYWLVKLTRPGWLAWLTPWCWRLRPTSTCQSSTSSARKRSQSINTWRWGSTDQSGSLLQVSWDTVLTNEDYCVWKMTKRRKAMCGNAFQITVEDIRIILDIFNERCLKVSKWLVIGIWSWVFLYN